MNIFNLFRSKVNQLKQLVKLDGLTVAIVKDREYGTVQRVFVVSVTSRRMGFTLLGWTDPMMNELSIGYLMFDSSEYMLLEVKPIYTVRKKNTATPNGYRAYIEYWSSALCYDEKLVIMKSGVNVPISIRANGNVTSDGFGAEKPHPTPERPHGVMAVFIRWEMLPYLPVTLDMSAKPVLVEDFNYYDWMGDRVRDELILETRKIAKATDIEYRIKAFQEKHTELQRELADLFKLIWKEK